MVKLGQLLKNLRLSRNLTQKEAAEKVGVAQHFLSQIEQGKREPNRRLLSSFIDFFLQSGTTEDLSPLIAAVIEDVIPGAQCDVQPGAITAHLSTGSTTLSLGKAQRIHDPASQPIIEALRDLTIRDALLSIIKDANLLAIVKALPGNPRLRKLLKTIGQMNETELNLLSKLFGGNNETLL